MNAIEQGKAAESGSSAAQAALKNRMDRAQQKAKEGSLESIVGKKRIRPFPKKELIKLCRGLASMLKAQINTSDALKYYSHGHPSADVRKTLDKVRAQVDAGSPTYIAFAKTGRFDDKFVSLVRAGTDSGQIHKAFDSISHRLQKEAEFRKKMKKATVLPGIIISVLIGLFIIAQVKIVPEVEGMLGDFNAEPDPFSKTLFKVSHVVQKVWPVMVIGLMSLACVFFFVTKVRNFIVNMLMSKWRLLRQLIMGMRQMLFLGALNMLHSNGVTLAKSIEIASQSLKGTAMYDEMREAGRRYQTSGLPFSEAIRKFTSCDEQVAHMVSIGERSSSLGGQLSLLTNMYEEDVDVLVEDFTAAINFIVLAMAAVLISTVFIGAFLPIFLMGPKLMNSEM